MKKKLADVVIENLKKDHKGHDPKGIIRSLCTDLLGEAEKKLKSSWKPPPYDPVLLTPFRSVQIIEKDKLEEQPAILEPITERNFNLYYSQSNISPQHLRMFIAREIVYSFFSPAKKIYDERIKNEELDSIAWLDELSEIGAYELLMPTEPFKAELHRLGFSPLACYDLVKMFDVTRLMILQRMAAFAPCPCSIAILHYDNPPDMGTNENILQNPEDSILTIEELIKAKASKTDRYRIVLAINSHDFHYNIPLNKSMPPETIFYHSALFNKPLSGPHQMKIDNKKVKFEVDVMSLAGSKSNETYPPLLAFFKIT